jgi:hypothetical protein
VELKTYELTWNDDRLECSFSSIGPKGTIPIKVTFEPLSGEINYNLSFKVVDGSDITTPGNGDGDMILKTVGRAVSQFIVRFPRSFIYFQGRSRVLNRLYRIYLSRYHAQIILMLDVYGYKDGKWERYARNTEYESYFGTRRGNRDFDLH